MAVGDIDLSQLRQRAALTGRPMTPAQIRAVLESDISARLGRQTEIGRLGLAREQEARVARQTKEKLEAEEEAAEVSGAIQLGGLGLTGALVGSQLGLFGGAAPVAGALGLSFGGAAPVAGAVPGVATTPTLTGLGTAPTAGGGGIAGGAPIIAAPFVARGAQVAGRDIGQHIGGEFGGEVGAGFGGTGGIGAIGAGVERLIGGETGQIARAVVDPIGTVLSEVGGAIGTVICTELHRQGVISNRVLQMTKKYRMNYVSQDVYDGYMTWGPTVVKMMKKSKVANWLMKPVWKRWVQEMAHRANPRIESSLVGKVVLDTLTPVSSWIGRIKRSKHNFWLLRMPYNGR